MWHTQKHTVKCIIYGRCYINNFPAMYIHMTHTDMGIQVFSSHHTCMYTCSYTECRDECVCVCACVFEAYWKGPTIGLRTGIETLRMREGVRGERDIRRCRSASASKKKVAAVLPYASLLSRL